MKLAIVKDFEIYNRKLLGLTLKDRIKKTLERSGFTVEFFDHNLILKDAEAYLLILEPVLILERDLILSGRKILVSDGFTFGYLFGKEFKNLFNGDISVEKYISTDNFERQEIRALRITEENLKHAEKLLLDSLIKKPETGLKPAYYDGIVARMINRKISLKITKFLAERDITPNQITVFSFFLSILGSFLFLLNEYFTTLLAGLMVQLHSIIDGCDGEIARLKFMESKYGAWLDGVLDRYSDFIIIFCVTYALAQTSAIYWIIGFLAAFASFMIAYTGDKFVAAYKRTYTPRGFKIPITRDVRLFIIFFGALFNLLVLSLSLIAILGNAESLRRIISLRGVE